MLRNVALSPTTVAADYGIGASIDVSFTGSVDVDVDVRHSHTRKRPQRGENHSFIVAKNVCRVTYAKLAIATPTLNGWMGPRAIAAFGVAFCSQKLQTLRLQERHVHEPGLAIVIINVLLPFGLSLHFPSACSAWNIAPGNRYTLGFIPSGTGGFRLDSCCRGSHPAVTRGTLTSCLIRKSNTKTNSFERTEFRIEQAV